jgi:serine/threonine-protein kinase
VPSTARRSVVLFVDVAPAGAEIWEGDHVLGQAPMQISIDNETARKEPRRFIVKRAGFQPYSIVQGPSDENVRINGMLVAVAGETAPAPVAAAVPSTVKEHVAPVKASKAPRIEPAAPVVSAAAAPVGPAASTPPPHPSDIRLQR